MSEQRTEEAQRKLLSETVNSMIDYSTAILKGIDDRLKDVTEREEKRQKLMESLEENISRASTKISFNVGGKSFTTHKETLLRFPETYFTAMIGSERFKPEDGVYFIDRNPKIFAVIMEYLRTGQLDTKSVDQERLQEELDYFQLPSPLQPQKEEPFLSNLITSEMKKLVEQWTGNKKIGRLLWRASKDGFGVAKFHELCDNQGATVMFIQSNNDFIFGGYNSNAWNRTDRYTISSSNFLFTITNPHGVPAQKFAISNTGTSKSACCHSGYGPIFGGHLHDLVVYNNSDIASNSSIGFPNSYQDTTGRGHLLFTGSPNFQTKEIEIYTVV